MEVEHTFIDYQFMIMGEKIKHLKRNKPGEFKLDQFTLSQMMDGNLLEFYSLETIQDIIKIQWNIAQDFTKMQLKIYFVLFVCPFIINCLCQERITTFWWKPIPPAGLDLPNSNSQFLYKDREIQRAEMNVWLNWIRYVTIVINIFPVTLLLFIEGVQMKSLGLNYFLGWNIMDITFILTFFFYAIGKLTGNFIEHIYVYD